MPCSSIPSCSLHYTCRHAPLQAAPPLAPASLLFRAYTHLLRILHSGQRLSIPLPADNAATLPFLAGRAGENPRWIGPEIPLRAQGSGEWYNKLSVFNYTKRASMKLLAKKKEYKAVEQVVTLAHRSSLGSVCNGQRPGLIDTFHGACFALLAESQSSKLN